MPLPWQVAELMDWMRSHRTVADPHGDRQFTTDAVATHAGAADPHGDRAYADNKDAAHAGIADAHSTTLFLAGLGMGAMAGAPAQGNSNTNQGWLLDAAATESVQGPLWIPEHWTTYNVFAWWLPTVAAAGNVRLQMAFGRISSGLASAASVQTAVTAASPGAVQLARTQVGTGLSLLSTDVAHNLRCSRLGADALDTYASDILLLGLEVVKAS